MIKNNLSIYFARFCRHLILTKQWKDIITYLDLSHSFRCLVDVKKEIDLLLSQEGYICKFNHVVNRRKLIKNSFGGISIFNEITTESGTHPQINFINEIIEEEAIINSFQYIKTEQQMKEMTFTQWLSCEVASIKDPDKKVIPISREEFIKRIANKFGGSHPFETEFNINSDKNIELVYRYIDWMQCIQLPVIKYGYLLIEDLAEQLAMSMLDFFINDPTNRERKIFLKCKEVLTK